MKALILCFMVFIPALLFSQVMNPHDERGYKCTVVIIDGDTLPVVYYGKVDVTGNKSFRNSADARQWQRLVYNVKIAYPYAKLAGIKFAEYSKKLETISSEREKKLMMKKAEDELQAQFGAELKDLTFTQGKILLKLVDRQTANCPYDIVVEFRGRFVAFFWQGIGKLFGYDLKSKYDPLHEDADIERIVIMIENGSI
ncbi:MAG: DUF4294 domain-containing protein [Bacteroidetes bacterium]|nr:DUF4294 domain-containing protein [Bacteroidota bacterium]